MTDADPVEGDYLRAIAGACNAGDTDRAFELSIGLEQYRELYKSGDLTERKTG